MFESWMHTVVFGIIVTFFTGLIASIVARADINQMNKKA